MSESLVKDFNTLKKNLKKDFTGKRPVSIALLGDSSTQLLNHALKAYGFDAGIDFRIFESDYDQIDAQVLNTSSELYESSPEFVIIFQNSFKLLKKFSKTESHSKLLFAEKQIHYIETLYNTLTVNTKTKVIYFNFSELDDNVFGNFANKVEISFIYQLRKINYELMQLAGRCKDLFIFDYALLNAQWGKHLAFDAKMYYTSEMVISLEMIPWVVKGLTDMMLSIKGTFKKCLILDLDNTTWGGIIGDDGIENIQIGDLGIGKAFTELQLWAKQLKERGIILAVCSKNNEATAKEPFEKHPDMVLSLKDIAVFVANWGNKADNIRYIQSILNIGFDSMVFLDDNPAERSLVKRELPDVTVPELPEDPSLYLEFIQKLNLFETASFSEEDGMRTKQYQEEAGRNIAQKSFTNEDDFLASLEMISEVKPFNKFNTPRVAQLSQRSNQFNLRTVRYTESDIEKIAHSSSHEAITFNLKDKFGDNGLICVIILEKKDNDYFIDTWFMSCRVLKRGMENFTLNTIVKKAKENGIKKIIGEFIPTNKNSMVKDHYKQLGFLEVNGKWELRVENYLEKKCFILASYQ